MAFPKVLVTVHYDQGHPTGLTACRRLLSMLTAYGEPSCVVEHTAYWTFAVPGVPPYSVSCKIGNPFRKSGKVTKLTIKKE